MRAELEEMRRQVEQQAEADRTDIFAPQVATVLLAREDVAGAVGGLERSYRQRHPQLRFITWGIDFARLGGNRRYVDLRWRIGLPN